jgi:diacylglycerol kinase family enzyme
MLFLCPMRAILVHNPEAGKGDHSADDLVSLLAEHDVEASYYSVDDKGHANAIGRAKDLVIAAGGDGTVKKVAAKLRDRAVPIAILPLGTANNIARSLGIAGKPAKIVKSWRKALTRRFDVGAAIGPWGKELFLEAVGAGALANGLAELEGKKLKGGDAIRTARRRFAKALKKAEPMRAAIAADGKALPDDLLLVEIMNTTSMGPRLYLAEGADPGDGYLDVVFLPRAQRAKMLDWLKNGKQDSPAPLPLLRVRNISIDWDGAPLRIGDELAPQRIKGGRVRIELEREAIQFLSPLPGDAQPSARRAGR